MTDSSKTQVAIIGGGPAGMLLSILLHREGIDSVVIERASRDHVLSRIRAGVLEWSAVELLRRAGVGKRMDEQGHVHNGTRVAWKGEHHMMIDSHKYANRQFMAYGQTYITEDLYAEMDRIGGQVYHQAENVTLHDLTDNPFVTFNHDGRSHRIDCAFIAGCDGFHGVSRKSIPEIGRAHV